MTGRPEESREEFQTRDDGRTPAAGEAWQPSVETSGPHPVGGGPSGPHQVGGGPSGPHPVDPRQPGYYAPGAQGVAQPPQQPRGGQRQQAQQQHDLSSARLLRQLKRPPQSGWRRAVFLSLIHI